MGHTARGCLRPRRVERATQPAPPTPEELRRQAEIERELLLARDIQQGLLLEAVPQLPGWEISAVSTPARDLGGDLYDFLPLGDGWHGVMIGDVSGKGLPAALRMAVARTVFRHEARRGEPPGATLAAVNRGIISEIPQGMVTMLYAVLDTHRGLIRMANAGHTYPVLLNGCIEELELSGLPLGVDTDSDYDETTAIIRPGTTVLLYTDGVIEAGSPSEEYFGYDRLAALLADHANQRPRALVAALLHELRGWSGGSQSDDITVVVLRRRLEHLDAELRSVADDVLGAERAAQLWEQIDAMPDVEGDGWGSRIPELVRLAQTRFGRGLARELNAQLRLTVEEYR
jgi:sigma-B regulation protein RsbU (phosphoserine phosphatase)